ncbi:MAG: hypothetical protein JWP69_2010 [Flaviaesturariibacter sp.]|nr:hypothetical protein [Flaviaesturariibacter sp.]
MKKILFCLLLIACFGAEAQVYNNEWIDFDKTYYKFKVGGNGLRRIPQTTLAAAGLGTVPAEHFQLWRNGAEVPIYTSATTGGLGANGYIEFWGQMNDGSPDRALYRDQTHLLNDKWSLQTDTATYFLTVNASGNNLRLTPTVNNVAGNVLPAEPYFIHKVGNYFKNQINSGYAVNVGEYLYSSTYDRGEGWSSTNIGTNATNSFTFTNLFPYTAGPDAKFSIAVSGNATNPRRYRANLNGDSLIGNQINFLNILRDSTTFPATRLATGSAAIAVTNVTNFANDRMVIHQYEITYPRLFNFGGASNFEFILPASGSKYLQITGFDFGSVAPVLYDIANGKRYVGDISSPEMVKIVLEASTQERKLVLVRQEASNITTVTTLESRTFTNYALAANQGDYLIISNPLLFNGPNGTNPVEEYRLYRNSTDGGGHRAKTYLIQDLVDQFAFGIKKHPLAIRNFLMFARDEFSTTPKHVFLIGKPVNYVAARNAESNPAIETLNLVPTFGNPASDIMLSADPGTSNPLTPIGRISVINGQEVKTYLDKVKQFEAAQKLQSPLIADKAWMKNIVHAVGISEPQALAEVDGYMANYKRVISDTLFGGKVTTFTKSSPNSVEQVNAGELDRLFAEGITLLTYFGHSSANTLEFNLNNPDQYNNTGKYPMFIALGCNAGNFFGANRNETLSEKFVLAPQKGSIGFLASSHFGITTYLDIYNSRIYENISVKSYGKSMGEILVNAVSDVFASNTQDDFYARVTCEESILNADPAIRLNPHAKPDYVVEDALVRVSPAFVSVADPTFNFKAKFMNIGKAINVPISREVKRQYPNGTIEVIYKDTIPGIRYADSLQFDIPINALRDKGTNKLTVTIDADGVVNELFENNNSITKEIVVFEDEARPIYPYNLSIVNKQNIKFTASTANALVGIRNYRMEIDTTENFDSPLKASSNQTGPGGIIEFSPSLSFADSTVYYWRVGLVPQSGNINWTNSSFIYIQGSETGFNQSHYFQHKKSVGQGLTLDSVNRTWNYDMVLHSLYVVNTMYPTGGTQDANFSVSVDGNTYIRSACVGRSLVFNVFDGKTFKPWKNVNANGASLFLYGSGSASCATSRNWNFEFSYMSAANRKTIMDFMDIIPVGSYVVVRSFDYNVPGSYSSTWRADTALYGSNNSLYHKLLAAGFTQIDSIDRPRDWSLIYQKGNLNIEPKQTFSQGIFDRITLSADCFVPDNQGKITSPTIGPALQWKKLYWTGQALEANSADQATVNLLGLRMNGVIDTLQTQISPSTQGVDISFVDARIYPYLKLQMKNADTVNHTPNQLRYWRITYSASPEGAVAPNLLFTMKDTFEVGEPINFKLAFKNISDANFDSLKVTATITDRNNVTRIIQLPRTKPLVAGDTVQISFPLDSRQLSGSNSLFLEVNPNDDQPELHHFNNYIFKNFYVTADTLDPLLDVTFDNQHILNGDIVAAKPGINIKLSDNARFNMLDDTSLINVQVRYPNGELRTFHFNSDTLQFIPASTSSGNTASVNFHPYFTEDGDYELIVSGKDKSANQAGRIEYRVSFQVINKAMISNMLNYPNPFTTSTAFVFTITGAEVPQNLKIQILTVTGKIVREITREELGVLRVGRNITEFKWNGTDQFGQPVGNGVYLYRVITNLNGKSLEKYKAPDDKTDRYFNAGYGKMYLMR